jgi:hypothetical protein
MFQIIHSVLVLFVMADNTGPLGLPVRLDADSDFMKDYQQAITYLRGADLARKMIDILESSTNVYHIVPGAFNPVGHEDVGNGYLSTTRTIYWYPRHGLEWEKSAFGGMNFRSAAMGLMHELGHAYQQETDPVRYANDTEKALHDRIWDTAEEKRVIKEIENRVAKTLGEPTRDFHNPAAAFKFNVRNRDSSISRAPKPLPFSSTSFPGIPYLVNTDTGL